MSVALCVPCYGNLPTRAFDSICKLITKSENKITEFYSTDKELTFVARNNLAKKFLEGLAEWSFWIDSDMVVPYYALDTLISAAKVNDALFMTGVTNLRGQDLPAIFARQPGVKYKNEYSANPVYIKNTCKIDFCGLFCCVIHRDAFRKLEFPFFRFINLEDKSTVLEDFYLCKSLSDAGVDLFASPLVSCEHLN